MKTVKKLSAIFLLLSLFSMSAKQDITGFKYVETEPIHYANKSGITIRDYSINGGQKPCIWLTNCHDIHITKCKLQGSSTPFGAVFLIGCYNIYVDTCIIQTSFRGVNAQNCTNNIRVVHNRFYNILDPFINANHDGNAVQFNRCNGAGLRIDSNKCYQSVQSMYVGDQISLYKSSGTPGSWIKVYYNEVRGGSLNPVGFAGINVADGGGSYQDIQHNKVINGGMQGMQIAGDGGSYINMSNNYIYGIQTSVSNEGLNVSVNANGGNITAGHNIINWKKHDGSQFNKYSKLSPLPTDWSTNIDDSEGKVANDRLLPKVLVH